MISGKYKLRIVWDLKDGPRRYGEIRTGLLRGSDGSAEIAPRVLSRELKALTEAGLIDRKDFGVVPPKVEYRLTRKGRSFVPVIAAIRNWGMRHLAPVETSDGMALRSRPPERLQLAGDERIVSSAPGRRLEPAPWPQMKPTSSPSGSSFSVIELISVAWLPPGRSVRPTEPLNKTSPTWAKRNSVAEEHDAARRMAGAMQDVEGEFADRDLLAFVEPAVGPEIAHAGHAEPLAAGDDIVEQIFVGDMRTFDLDAPARRAVRRRRRHGRYGRGCSQIFSTVTPVCLIAA